MCNDRRHIWCGHQCDGKVSRRKLVHPHRRRHSPHGDDQLSLDKPKPDSFCKGNNYQNQKQIDAHRDGKCLLQHLRVSASQPEREEPLRCGRHRPRQESEHHHHARHHVVDPVVLRAERCKHHANRVQRHEHDQYLPEVEEERVLCDARCASHFPSTPPVAERQCRSYLRFSARHSLVVRFCTFACWQLLSLPYPSTERFAGT